ncbi:MAG TPA: hypothetical protein VEF72_05960 [Mycobacterium sp.]|nr:hypothetical protein [Mycobacterium sp.]
MISNEAKKALAAIDDLDALLNRIAALPLHALTTQQKLALLAQLEALGLVLPAAVMKAAGVQRHDGLASESAIVRECAAS